MGIVYIILVGLVAGWLAGLITRGSGFGFFLNIVIGIIGAFVGRWLAFDVFSFSYEMTTLNQIITALIGAIALLLAIGILRALFR